jgi:hypothetical protein
MGLHFDKRAISSRLFILLHKQFTEPTVADTDQHNPLITHNTAAW